MNPVQLAQLRWNYAKNSTPLSTFSPVIMAMTITSMQSRFSVEANTSLENIGGVDDIETSESSPPSNEQAGSADKDPFNRVSHPRVQFIRLTSLARTGRGTPGATPPFQPAAPSLYRPIEPEQSNESAPAVLARDPSPLRHLALSSNAPAAAQRYDSPLRDFGETPTDILQKR